MQGKSKYVQYSGSLKKHNNDFKRANMLPGNFTKPERNSLNAK